MIGFCGGGLCMWSEKGLTGEERKPMVGPFASTVLMILCLSACKGTQFGGTSGGELRPAVQTDPRAVSPKVQSPVAVEKIPQSCSQEYEVPATSNPYLAGMPDSASLTYNLTSSDPQSPIDRANGQAPILIVPSNASCFGPGSVLAFTASGGITHNKQNGPSDANGDATVIVSHQLGEVNGKSDITAPIDSLIGVFLSESDPRQLTPAAKLDFSTPASRDYKLLSPQLGQIFFVGTGRTAAGDYRQVTVPAGATRLYFATMDTYQWNNNEGALRGSILIYK